MSVGVVNPAVRRHDPHLELVVERVESYSPLRRSGSSRLRDGLGMGRVAGHEVVVVAWRWRARWVRFVAGGLTARRVGLWSLALNTVTNPPVVSLTRIR